MLFLDTEEIPHATSDYLYHADYHQQYCRLEDVGDKWGQCQSPSKPKYKIEDNGIIVKLSIFKTQMIPQKLMPGTSFQEPPIIFLNII